LHNTGISSNAPLSRTCVSTITGTGQTFIDAVNIIVPREQGGEIGDTLLYKTSDTKYYWLKGHQTLTGTASSNGSNCYDESELTTAGFKIIGFVGHRDGGECLIYCDLDSSGRPKAGSGEWDDYYDGTNSATPGPSTDRLQPIGNIRRRNGTSLNSYYGTWIASGSMEVSERLFENGTPNTHTWPVKRSVWNAVVENIMSNTAYSTTSGINSGSATVTVSTSKTTGTGSITYTTTEGSVTIDPADYDYDFNKWYKRKIMLQFPTTDGCMIDLCGRRATALLKNCNNTTKNSAGVAITYPAAKKCWEYAISGVSDFAAGEWWMTSIVELWYLLKNEPILRSKGLTIGATWYWSCTQNSAANAWNVNFGNGYVNNYSKSSARSVFAVSAFHI